MTVIADINSINVEAWQYLTERSVHATWFQTKGAYDFFDAVDETEPFVLAIERADNHYAGLVTGYITKEKLRFKQFFTRRAIIVGGPLLANDITEQELSELLCSLKDMLKRKAIYIETRNFSDYGSYKQCFENAGFKYVPHLNFRVNTQSTEIVESNIGKNRKRDIRASLRSGAMIVQNPTKEQVEQFYQLLKRLYKEKIHLPLFSWQVFEKLYEHDDCRFLLVEYGEKIIGGTMLMCLQGKAVYEWFVCGEDGQYKNIFPSSVATYAGLQYAAANGYPLFDMMGAGTPDKAYGVRDFKARFGGELVEYGRFLNVRNQLLYNIGKFGVKILKFSKLSGGYSPKMSR